MQNAAAYGSLRARRDCVGMSLALYLLGNDLRLHDNRALAHASKYDSLLIVYCVDPRWFVPNRFGLPSIGPHRWRFIKESLADLASSLQKKSQHLFVEYGTVAGVAETLIPDLLPDVLLTSDTHGWYERKGLEEIQQRFPTLPLIFSSNATLFSCDGTSWLSNDLPNQFTPFRKRAETQDVPHPLSGSNSLPPMPSKNLRSNRWSIPDANVLPHWAATSGEFQTPFTGGETSAENYLRSYFSSELPHSYKSTRNKLDGWHNSSKWSSWLAQGCLSPRRVHGAIQNYEHKHGPSDSTYWLKFELLWREYFHWLAIKLGKALFSFQGTAKHAPLTSFYPERYKRWCVGNTPSPLVNACMRELSTTGYISNRGRQITASYLVNELEVDWRYGAAWFEHQLIDYDVGSNWGNWQYIAGVGADPRGGRHFNPDKQQRQFDPDYRYVKRWLIHDYESTTPARIDSIDAAGWPID
ncbi:MAG: DASH family cryptochrome [Pseudomonadales bacterium]|nr:MAG: DASH family cryptochrome [Pseudomonadales bacterium]